MTSNLDGGKAEYSAEDLKKNIIISKTCCKELFGQLENVNLYTLKLHMLDYIFEEVSKFGEMSYLDASLSEIFNDIMK